ncbi:MAG: nucleotidyltransferase family protein [Methylococcaceae bacterium]|nr:MAG: nucleotidyltransferase family protein [Methylococcaceae bacterium]
MNALLLAAGLGTRLRPLTDKVPKCLVPIHGKPLLAYWLDRLFACKDIEQVMINTHYLSDVVHEFIETTADKEKITQVYEAELLGTGGTVLHNASFFNGLAFMVIHADNLSRFDVGRFIARHRARPPHCAITMMIFETDSPKSCGIVALDAQEVVVGFYEKVDDPPGILANGAVYIFEPEVLAFMRTLNQSVIDLSTEVLPHFIGRIYTFINTDYHRDIGSLESLRLAEIEYVNQ